MVWLRRLAWGVGALLLVVLLAWLAVPALIKWQLPVQASAALGRQVSLGDASFHPWNLDLTLKDLSIAGEPGSSEPLLTLASLHSRISVSSIVHLAPVIRELELDGVRLRIARIAEGHYDIDDLIARLATPAANKPADGTTHFALYNVQVRDGELRFDDRPVGQVQVIDQLRLALPFISNLPAEIDVDVDPRLAFRLNGAPFDTGAQARPFAQTRRGEMSLKLSELDLARYVRYLPPALPVRLTQGLLSADIGLDFSVPSAGAPVLILKGSAQADHVAATDSRGAPLLAWERIQVKVRELRPLTRAVDLDSLRVDGLQLHASRDASGRLNLLALGTATGAPEPARAASAAAVPQTLPWKVQVASIGLGDARIFWDDAAVHPAASLQLDGLSVDATGAQWPLVKPIAVRVSGAIRRQGVADSALAQFSAEGPVTDHDARLALKLEKLSIGGFAPYLAQALVPAVDGQLGAAAELDWSDAAQAPRLSVHLSALSLDQLTLHDAADRPGQNAVSLKQLGIGEAQVDLLARVLTIDSLKLAQPSLSITRDQGGRLNVLQWLAASSTPAASVSASTSPSAPPGPAWQMRLKSLAIDDGQVRLSDAGVRTADRAPVRLDLAKLHVGLQNLAWQAGRAASPAALQLSAQFGGTSPDRVRPTGQVEYAGSVGVSPLQARGQLKLERLPVHLLAPYFADEMPLSLLRAEAGYKGSVDMRQTSAGIGLNAAGDLLLADVHIATLPQAGAIATSGNTEELLSWQALAFKSVKLAVAPRVRPKIDIGEAVLTDFYSRLVVTEQGRFNLQDFERRADHDTAPPAAAPSAAAGAAPSDSAPLPVDARVGAITLTNGKVDFTDHFIRPNYSAALTELNGRLGAFSTSSHDMATLSLHGRAEGTALLEISGQLNPLAKPLALDIRAKATDLELAPLSPYAGKYVGYAIERGKLTMDVNYKIDPDGKLDASNQVVLNQLTFGDKIESKDALKLPVLLAVALLKDRNGVIDINLPVSGSINDPKFSVGGLIFKVIVNLLTKALTSPFSLLSGGGGADDLSQVPFRPGTASIEPSGTAAIDKVAKALTERPALKMTVTGAADPAAERDAFQAAALEQRLADEQRREALRAGAPAAPASAPMAMAADERARLLKQVYRETDIPGKPRNPLGFAKDIAGPEMEALLKARVPADDDAMRELALKRGIAVRDALMAKGLPSERLFLAQPKLERVDSTVDWTPKVQLSMSAN